MTAVPHPDDPRRSGSSDNGHDPDDTRRDEHDHDAPEQRRDPHELVVGELVPDSGRTRSVDPRVHRVTSARRGTTEDQRHRQNRYFIGMAIRTVCFLGAIWAWSLGAPEWLTWGLVLSAAILPYVAVVMANAGRENDGFTPPHVQRPGFLDIREISSGDDGHPGGPPVTR